jgi:hypothetical protein
MIRYPPCTCSKDLACEQAVDLGVDFEGDADDDDEARAADSERIVAIEDVGDSEDDR